MDMGISVASDLNERYRSQDNIKVYTRRSRVRNLKNKTSSDTKVISEKKNEDKAKDDQRVGSNNDINMDVVAEESVTQDLNSDTKVISEEINEDKGKDDQRVESNTDINMEVVANESATQDLSSDTKGISEEINEDKGKNDQRVESNNDISMDVVADESATQDLNSDTKVISEEIDEDKGKDDQRVESNTDINIDVVADESATQDLDSDTKDISEEINEDKGKDDQRVESNNNINTDVVANESATQNLNPAQEEEYCIVPDETVEIVDIENLDPVEEDNKIVLDQSLQMEPTADLNLVQGTENGPSKPIFREVDGRISISLVPARPKNEVRQLKRKLENDLDLVRSFVQKLDSKKIQLSSYPTSNGGYDGNNGHLLSQGKDVKAQVRVNSVLGPVDHNDSRPFQNLSIEVFENNQDGNEFFEKEKRTPKENQYYRSSEFLLAKDRLPPETNKNLKMNGFRKHSGELGYGFVRNKYNAKALRSCNNMITRLMRHKFAWVFNKPVDAKALGLHDYHYIIRNPMDLGTIKSKLAKNQYKSPPDFAEDVRLTFRNAMTYNPQGSDVYIMAEEMWHTFEDKWVALESEMSYDWRFGLGQEMNLHSPLSRKVHPSPPPSLSRPPAVDVPVMERSEPTTMPVQYIPKPKPPVVRKLVPKKPKSKDPNKRDMTPEEKQRLSTQLQDLPPEKLDSIVQIVNKNNGSVAQRDEEVELDMDTLNAETLWELDRLVTNYKKNMSKRKRRAEIAQARADARPPVSAITNNVPATTQATKESLKAQNNVSAFPLPGDRSSSSSSSSSDSDSDSDSDSSDSDSDSSSGYRSPKS